MKPLTTLPQLTVTPLRAGPGLVLCVPQPIETPEECNRLVSLPPLPVTLSGLTQVWLFCVPRITQYKTGHRINNQLNEVRSGQVFHDSSFLVLEQGRVGVDDSPGCGLRSS